MGITLLAAGCFLFGPSETEEYSLVRAGGQTLPATVISVMTTEGVLYEVQVLRGIIRFFDNGELEKERDFRNVWNGVPSDTITAGRWSGTYERTDTTILVRLKDSDGMIETTIYKITGNGLVLQGVEGIGGAFIRVYEYLL